MKTNKKVKVNFEYWTNDSNYLMVTASGSVTPSGRIKVTRLTWNDDYIPVPAEVAEDIERVAEVELQRESGL